MVEAVGDPCDLRVRIGVWGPGFEFVSVAVELGEVVTELGADVVGEIGRVGGVLGVGPGAEAVV